MRMRRFLATTLAALFAVGCAHFSDPCTKPRYFQRFTPPSRAYYALPEVKVTSLPPAVQEAVAVRIRQRHGADEYFEIVSARVSDRYLLLVVRGACVDCDLGFVYSPEHQCVVGTFVPHSQG